MRRVVVTGLGAVSPLGNSIRDVTDSLLGSRSGMVFNPRMQELGFRCQVFAPVRSLDPVAAERQTPPATRYAIAAGVEAVTDAQIDLAAYERERSGVVIGTILGGISEANAVEQRLLEQGRPRRGDVAAAVSVLNTNAASQLASRLGAHGRVYSVNSACASGPDVIGHAYEMIAYDLQDVVICGATEEDTWKQMGPSYDNWNAMPAAYNACPTRACRPFDVDRAGFVLGAGAGVLVLEAYDAARRRGAPIYAEVAGYGAANDGADMVHPTGVGARRSALQALATAAQHGVQRIDYLNPHGAGTPVGDAIEVAWIKDVLSMNTPLVSSTKALAGHAMGAAGALEAVYTLIMMREGFVAPTLNLDKIAPECEGVRHVRTLAEQRLRTAMTVNAGLGGANAAVIFSQV